MDQRSKFINSILLYKLQFITRRNKWVYETKSVGVNIHDACINSVADACINLWCSKDFCSHCAK